MSRTRSETMSLAILWLSVGFPYAIAMTRIDDLGVQVMLTAMYLVAVLSIVRLINRSRTNTCQTPR